MANLKENYEKEFNALLAEQMALEARYRQVVLRISQIQGALEVLNLLKEEQPTDGP